jgi:5-methylcytosine-specific restriction enzyme subunit McrC
MSIPIKNIYYLLSYGWGADLEYSHLKGVDASNYDTLLALLCDVFVKQCDWIIKRNLVHSYVAVNEEYPGIKGKLDFYQTLNRQLLRKGRAACVFDEWSSNILANQLLKSTLLNLLLHSEITHLQKREIRRSLLRMGEVKPIELQFHLFGMVNLQRNNRHYRLALQVAQLIFENTVLDEKTGERTFFDIGRDHQKLAKLFERFAFEFYRKHAPFEVKKERIKWLADRHDYLPAMYTDITLVSNSRKVIIDTKFYGSTLSNGRLEFGANKFQSANLYQIFAYVSNVSDSGAPPINRLAEGILLYPTVEIELSEKYVIKNHPISVFTVNLNANWESIHERMLEVIV